MGYEGSLSIDEKNLMKILRAIKNRGKYNTQYKEFKNSRDMMMIVLSWFLALRPKECFASRVHHLTEGYLFVPSENNKERQSDFHPIPKKIIPFLKKYLNKRQLFFPESEWLFPSISTKRGIYHMGLDYYERIFRDACKKAGLYFVKYIDKQGNKRGAFTPYGLRKGGAYFTYEKTGDIVKTDTYLRHRDPRLRATMRYIQINRDKMNKETSKIFNSIRI